MEHTDTFPNPYDCSISKPIGTSIDTEIDTMTLTVYLHIQWSCREQESYLRTTRGLIEWTATSDIIHPKTSKSQSNNGIAHRLHRRPRGPTPPTNCCDTRLSICNGLVMDESQTKQCHVAFLGISRWSVNSSIREYIPFKQYNANHNSHSSRHPMKYTG